MKRFFMYLLSAILLISVFIGFSFCVYAEPEETEDTADIEETADTEEPGIENGEEVPEEEQPADPAPEEPDDDENPLCICGRDYYTVTTTEHRKYDCTHCEVSSLTCRCDCWCGAKSYTGISVSGETVLFCSNCDQLCVVCACADRDVAILREQQTEQGILSVMGIQKPTNIFAGIFMLLFLTLVFASCYYAALSVRGVELPAEAEEKFSDTEIPGEKKTASNPVASVISSIKKLVVEDDEKNVPDLRVVFKSSPTLQLYNILCSQYRGIIGGSSQPVAPECSYKLSFTGSDMAELCFLAGLNSKASPIKPVGTVGDASVLESFALAESSSDGAVATAKGKALASVLFTPDEVISVQVSNGCVYDYCLHRGFGIVSVLCNGIYNLYANVTRDAFCDFINNFVAPRITNPDSEKISEEFSYEQWMTFMSACSEKSDSFGLRSLARLEKVDRFSSVFKGYTGYPLPEDVLSAESVMRILSELKDKGLLEGEGFGYSLSEKGKLFSFDSVKDTVSFLRENPGAGTAAMLFVYKTDRVINICDTGKSVRLLSCDNVQWSKFID